MKIRTLLFLFALGLQTTFAQVVLSGNSYTQKFDSIASGLPKGWSVYTGASATTAGTLISDADHLVLKPVEWGFPHGSFRNCASANGHRYFSNTDSTAQRKSSDRVLAVRQVGPTSSSFPGSDPGAAFVFKVVNTAGMTNFNLTFNLQSLDSISPRQTTWTIDYAIGNNPSVFIPVKSIGTMTTGGNTFSNNTISVNFNNAIDNKTEPVWIRIVALSSSDGSSYRATTGIDNFNLTWKGTNK